MKPSTAYLDDISDLDEDSESISNSDVDKISSGSISQQNKLRNQKLTESAGKLPFSGFMKSEDKEKNHYERKKTSNSIMLDTNTTEQIVRSNTILGKAKGYVGGYGVTAI